MHQLKELLQNVRYRVLQGTSDTAVTKLCRDSRTVERGAVFVAHAGMVCNGHAFVTEAWEKGAVAVVISEDCILPPEITVIRVADTRTAFAYMAAAFFELQDGQPGLIGITGTKGKTTVSFMIREILEAAGLQTGLMGTIGIWNGREMLPAANTTCEADVIMENLKIMAEEGLRYCVMEVSSQGLKLHRTEGLEFEAAVFTNISTDHIGPTEHADFAEYLECKGRLFGQTKKGFFNSGDPHWKEVAGDSRCRRIRFGEKKTDDYRMKEFTRIKEGELLGCSFQMECPDGRSYEIRLDLPGKYNAGNALAAAAVCESLSVPSSVIIKTLRHLKVRGRMEYFPVKKGVSIYIDYAHNALSLENALRTLRAYEPRRLVCVFGCGGNRSKYRRFEMGEVSGRLADFTITTTDNPRDEDPYEILSDIRYGLGKTMGDYIEIADRKEAVSYAVRTAEEGTVILLAGKGHETYEERLGKRRPMDERQLVREALEELNGGICQHHH